MTTRPPSALSTPEPWDLVAPGYVAENMVSFEQFAREALRLVPAHGDVIDIGAGPGSLALQAARTARRVQAIDFAPAMLDELRARATSAGVSNIEAQLGDAQALPFADESYDAAYSMFAAIFFPDKPKGLREMARVLRPGAHAVVSSWPPAERVPVFAALFGAMKAELPDSGIGDAPTALGTAEEMESALAAAGFDDIRVQEHSVVPGVVTPAQLWRTFARGGAPAVLMRRKMGEEGFAAFSERIVRRLQDTLGSDPIEVRLTALLGVGRR